MSEYSKEQREADERWARDIREASAHHVPAGRCQCSNCALLRLLDAARADLAEAKREVEQLSRALDRNVSLLENERAGWQAEMASIRAERDRLRALLDDCDDMLVNLTSCRVCEGSVVTEHPRCEDCRDGDDYDPVTNDIEAGPLIARIRAAIPPPAPPDAAHVRRGIEFKNGYGQPRTCARPKHADGLHCSDELRVNEAAVAAALDGDDSNAPPDAADERPLPSVGDPIEMLDEGVWFATAVFGHVGMEHVSEGVFKPWGIEVRDSKGRRCTVPIPEEGRLWRRTDAPATAQRRPEDCLAKADIGHGGCVMPQGHAGPHRGRVLEELAKPVAPASEAAQRRPGVGDEVEVHVDGEWKGARVDGVSEDGRGFHAGIGMHCLWREFAAEGITWRWPAGKGEG